MPYADIEQKRQYNRDRYAAAKRFWQTFIAQKDGYDTLVCVECGLPETDPRNPLTYSHNDPATKAFTLAKAIMTGILHKTHAEIEAEARKCSLRHLRCHSTFDHGTVYGPDGLPDHGYTRYKWYGCRCVKCVTARNEYQNEARATKRALKNLVPPKEWSTPKIEDITAEYYGQAFKR